MRTAFRSLPVPALLVLATIAASVAVRDTTEAAGFHVNVTYDAVDANPGDFICETAPGNGECTLRAAVMEANALPGADLVTLGEGEYIVGIANEPWGSDEDTGAKGDFDILDDLTLNGMGAEATVITAGGTGMLDVLEGVSAEISHMSLAGARSQAPNALCGSAIRNMGTLVAERVVVTDNFARGNGAVCNLGDLTFVDTAITHNSTGLYGLGAGLYNSGNAQLVRVEVSHNNVTFDGGGIYNSGDLTVTESTISGNFTQGPASSHFGGGIYNKGTMTITNATISDNYGQGGGIANFGTGTLTNVTLTANYTEEGDVDGGIRNQGDLTLTNTIVAGNEGGDCFGAVTSGGHNLDSDGTCGLGGAGDLSGVDPLLGELADNGGPTMTHALLEGSPAIDAGDDDACPETDQRGAPRPVETCDIGAYEASGVVPTPTATPTPTVFPSKPADIDCDDDVDSADALAILRFLAGMPWSVPGCPPLDGAQPADSPIPPSASPTPHAEHKRGDINCDGAVNVLDALAILRYAAGFPVALPPGCGELE